LIIRTTRDSPSMPGMRRAPWMATATEVHRWWRVGSGRCGDLHRAGRLQPDAGGGPVRYEEAVDGAGVSELRWDSEGYEGRWVGSGTATVGRIWMQPGAASDRKPDVCLARGCRADTCRVYSQGPQRANRTPSKRAFCTTISKSGPRRAGPKSRRISPRRSNTGGEPLRCQR